MSIRAEQVTYSIQVKTSDKLFAGTDNDVYIRIGCVKSKPGIHGQAPIKSEKYCTNSHRPVRAPSGAWIPELNSVCAGRFLEINKHC